MKQLYFYDEKSDEEIWDSLKKGNENALSIIFQHYYDQVYNYGLRLTADKELIKDVIQETFINIWKYRKRLAEVESVKVYLLISFRRNLLKFLKKKNKTRQKRDQWIQEISHQPSHEEELIQHTQQRFELRNLHEQVSQLSARQQEVIHLKFYHGLENQQIKEIMSISHQSVRNLLHESIKKLKSGLKKRNSGIS